MRVASFRYWEETDYSKYKGVKACGLRRCKEREGRLEGWLLTGDNAPDVTKGSPMSEGKHGQRPSKHDRGCQNLPGVSL